MHMTITKFKVSPNFSDTELTEMFELTVERYSQIPGLLLKHYFIAPDHWAGGVYLWESEVQAQAALGEEFIAAIRKRFGSNPIIESMHCPISLDNVHKRTSLA